MVKVENVIAILRDAFFAEFSARNAHIKRPRNFRWAYEFAVEDPDGHALALLDLSPEHDSLWPDPARMLLRRNMASAS